MKKSSKKETAASYAPLLTPKAKKKPVRKRALPRKDADLGAVSQTVALSWAANPALTLLWTTQAAFAADAAAFGLSLDARLVAGSNKPAAVQVLRNLDKEINAGISSLKIDVLQKFGRKDGPAEYARYGLAKKGPAYRFPNDRDSRLMALELVEAATTADGTGGTDYDPAFWQQMQVRYKAALANASTTDGAISTHVGSKNAVRARLRKTMKALQFLLRAHYPDSYKAVFRQWGWQKEDY